MAAHRSRLVVKVLLRTVLITTCVETSENDVYFYLTNVCCGNWLKFISNYLKKHAKKVEKVQ